MKAIILAAGGGSRLAPIGLTTPKILIPILNQPLIHFHINAVKDLVEEVIIIVGPNQFGQQIQHYIDSYQWPIPVHTCIQPEPLGTAHAFHTARNFFNETERVMCLLGDDVYSHHDLEKLSQHQFAILGKHVDDWQKWGILQTNEIFQLTGIVEKPHTFVGNIANTGAAVVTSEIFELFDQIKPSERGEYEFTDTLTLLSQKHIIDVAKVEDYWLPIGYPWHILQASQILATKNQTDLPLVGKNSKIESSTSIIGTSIIGNNVIIEDGASIENSIIFDNVRIGKNTQVRHSIIGKNVRIGQNVHFIDRLQHDTEIHTSIKGQAANTGLKKFGAVIGNDAQIGDDVTINPGIKIWPNTETKNNQTINSDLIL